MGIRIKKAMGYGTQDMAGCLGITTRQIYDAHERHYLDFVKFVEDFLKVYENEKIMGTEYLGAILHRFDCTSLKSGEHYMSKEIDWHCEDYDNSELFNLIMHDNEFGNENTVVFVPRPRLFRRDDDIDFNEYHARYGYDGDYEPKIEKIKTTIYPWSYMMKLNKDNTPWGIETYFPPTCYLDIPGEAEKHIPYVPYNIKLMLDFIAGRDMIEEYMTLRPMIYTYWS